MLLGQCPDSQSLLSQAHVQNGTRNSHEKTDSATFSRMNSSMQSLPTVVQCRGGVTCKPELEDTSRDVRQPTLSRMQSAQ